MLKGHGPADLTEVCLQLAANMLVLAGKGDAAHCRAMAEAVIADGSAFEKCKEMFAAQGGDIRVLDDYSLFAQPAAKMCIRDRLRTEAFGQSAGTPAPAW